MLRFVVSEDALKTEVGGARTMIRQMEYLVALDDVPNVHLRVLPATVSHNPVPGAGLALLRLGADRRSVGMLPVLYGPSTYLDDPVATGRLSRAFGRLEQLAMSAEASRRLIEELAKGPMR